MEAITRINKEYLINSQNINFKKIKILSKQEKLFNINGKIITIDDNIIKRHQFYKYNNIQKVHILKLIAVGILIFR